MRWIAALAFIGALAASCTDFDDSGELYGGTMWSGEYVIVEVDGNQLYSHVGKIEMFFVPGDNQCSVAFGYKGSCVITAECYEVRWLSRNRFSLYSSSGDQTLLCFSGTISGDKMKLQALNCDSVAATYELVNVSYQL